MPPKRTTLKTDKPKKTEKSKVEEKVDAKDLTLERDTVKQDEMVTIELPIEDSFVSDSDESVTKGDPHQEFLEEVFKELDSHQNDNNNNQNGVLNFNHDTCEALLRDKKISQLSLTEIVQYAIIKSNKDLQHAYCEHFKKTLRAMNGEILLQDFPQNTRFDGKQKEFDNGSQVKFNRPYMGKSPGRFNSNWRPRGRGGPNQWNNKWQNNTTGSVQ